MINKVITVMAGTITGIRPIGADSLEISVAGTAVAVSDPGEKPAPAGFPAKTYVDGATMLNAARAADFRRPIRIKSKVTDEQVWSGFGAALVFKEREDGSLIVDGEVLSPAAVRDAEDTSYPNVNGPSNADHVFRASMPASNRPHSSVDEVVPFDPKGMPLSILIVAGEHVSLIRGVQPGHASFGPFSIPSSARRLVGRIRIMAGVLAALDMRGVEINSEKNPAVTQLPIYSDIVARALYDVTFTANVGAPGAVYVPPDTPLYLNVAFGPNARGDAIIEVSSAG